MKNDVMVLGLLFGVVLAANVITFCTPAQRREARTVIDLADDGCLLVPYADQAVCVTADEVRGAMDHILANRRAKSDAGADRDAANDGAKE